MAEQQPSDARGPGQGLWCSRCLGGNTHLPVATQCASPGALVLAPCWGWGGVGEPSTSEPGHPGLTSVCPMTCLSCASSTPISKSFRLGAKASPGGLRLSHCQGHLQGLLGICRALLKCLASPGSQTRGLDAFCLLEPPPHRGEREQPTCGAPISVGGQLKPPM